MITQLFRAGLNILMIDMYSHSEQIKEVCEKSGYKIEDNYSEEYTNPYYYNNHKLQTIILIEDLAKKSGDKATRKILNHAGNADPDNLKALGVPTVPLPLEKKCSRPFREVVVHWDGSVPVCCIDWRHEFTIGNIHDNHFQDIWEGKAFQAARTLLHSKDRTVRPCYRCDYNGGFRLGLINLEDYIENQLTTEECKSIIKKNMQRNRRYEHKNAEGPIFLKKKKGIREFL